MSLAGQTIPVREPVLPTRTEEEVRGQSQRTSYRDSLPNAPKPPVYSEDAAYNETETAKMYPEYYEATTGPSPKKNQSQLQAPALPAKSSLRASRLLDGMALKIITNQPTNLTQAAPQEVYLSSEEEASSSADEFSDYEYESESAESADSPVRRKSHEDTARVVSVVYAGKPSIIDLPSTRRSPSPESVESRPASRMITSPTSPSLRRMSTSSACTPSSPPIYYPPRSSSVLLTSSMLPKTKPSFLDFDPYANKTLDEGADEEQAKVEQPERPKTPTSQLFKRTLSIVRKRSRPHLRDIAAANSSRERLSSPSTQQVPSEHSTDVEPEQKTPNSPWSAISYHDIMRAAKKNGQNQPPTPSTPVAQSPMSPAATTNTKSRILSGLANRRKSIKIG
ncbi:hypothetical protein CCHL11_07651 [Colletotrichum chlorophyti]|uniref:Uncharacterized protein n=1 Tax=Colletotrichum chlorophyti TaxID=708187 RepID=A0A1Q8RCR6_9PEZI|nr:hypothetical protein CCHL11_07651 [Colletotrichum chlorophyti]